MRRHAPSHPCVLMLTVAYAICGAARQHAKSSVVDGTESARALVEQARLLHQPQEVALKVCYPITRARAAARASREILRTTQNNVCAGGR